METPTLAKEILCMSSQRLLWRFSQFFRFIAAFFRAIHLAGRSELQRQIIQQSCRAGAILDLLSQRQRLLVRGDRFIVSAFAFMNERDVVKRSGLAGVVIVLG